ncbi:MAG: hypothetical protein ACFHHU_08365 [Porticoccaceae bacterium]
MTDNILSFANAKKQKAGDQTRHVPARLPQMENLAGQTVRQQTGKAGHSVSAASAARSRKSKHFRRRDHLID